jgi:hypothetical protein
VSLRDAWEGEAHNWVAWARRYADTVERDGLRMTFSSLHRPLEGYVHALSAAGFLVERLVEVPDSTDPRGARWQRLPLFLHIRAVRR